jgi:4-hydroxy-3-methylbut-2-enyl diphosphate reductase
MISVEIDRGSGFCGGVIRAIGGAEKALASGTPLWSLGHIVHNEAELDRLQSLGLKSISNEDLRGFGQQEESGEPVSRDPRPTLLIRAHGEPPSTYALAEEKGFEVLDFTCPVVLRIQKSIREAYARLHTSQPFGQIVIFGKIGHAEVLGLLGNTSADAIVIESEQMLLDCLKDGRIRKEGPLEVFSQTTKDPDEYGRICGILSAECGNVSVHHTICRQVASRHSRLETFARGHDVIVFVSGKESSNGKVLSAFCKKCNPRTFVALSPSDIDPAWFRPGDKVGVSGATSTPKWLLEQVACHIRNFAL